jgi:PhnB protein
MESQYKPANYSTVSPYLIVNGADATIDFLNQVFGAIELRRFPDESGKLMHAEVQIDDTVIMVADPAPPEGPPISSYVHIYVRDVDVTYRKALEAGTVSVQKPVKKQDEDKRGGVWRYHMVDRHMPRFVERELRSFLQCGILANGVHCDDCRKDRVVPFSCYPQRETMKSSPLRTGYFMESSQGFTPDSFLPESHAKSLSSTWNTPRRSSRRQRLFDRFKFLGRIRPEIDLCRLQARVVKPKGNLADVLCRLQSRHPTGMPRDMRTDVFFDRLRHFELAVRT